MKYILALLLVLMVTKPSDTEMKSEFSTKFKPMMRELVYEEFEHTQVVLDPMSAILVTQTLDFISEEIVIGLNILDFGFFKIIFNERKEVLAVGVLGNTYLLFEEIMDKNKNFMIDDDFDIEESLQDITI